MNWILVFFTCALSHAYIPEYSLIASHAADQHGKGAYLVEQEVTFRKESESYTVKETWIATGENNLRLTLEGRGPLKGLVQGTEIFEGSQKFFVDGSGPVRNQHLGDDWLEPLFYFRSPRYLRSRLVNLKVTPPESLRDRAPLPSDGDIKYEPPSFIRLSRVGGSISWEIGLNPALGPHPELWIEQDQFVVRKFRGSDDAVLHANDYAKFDDGFWYPRTRIYTFGPNTIEVHTLQVRSLGKIKPGDNRFRTSSLVSSRDALKLPEIEALKEFYSRFR